MFIRFKRDYDGYKNGQLVKVNNVKGYTLTKRGISDKIPYATPIDNIVVAQYVSYDKDNNLNRLHKSLFTCNNHSRANGTFIDMITNEEVPSSNTSSDTNVPVVDWQSIVPFRQYFKKDIAYTELEYGAYIDDNQLINFYGKLNSELSDDFIAEIK